MEGSFASGLRRHFESIGANAALTDARTDLTITYREFEVLLARFRRLARGRGLRAGDALVSFLPNSIECLIAFFGVASARGDFAPLSPDSSEREAAAWLEMVRPKLCLVARGAVGRHLDALRAGGVEVVEIDLDGGFAWLPQETADWSEEAGRLLLKTSGTTGEPKALVFSVDRLWASASDFMSLHPRVGTAPRFLNLLPMAYLGGLFNLGIIPLNVGGSVVVAEPFSGRTFLSFWQTVDRFDVTVLWLVPSIVRGLLQLATRSKPEDSRARARNVRMCFLGTAPIAPQEKVEFERTFGTVLLENFALSETTFLTSETDPVGPDIATRHCGCPVPYVEFRLQPLSGEDRQESGAAAEAGEIAVRTPYFWLGYLGKDGSLTRALDKDGFLHTGDVGRILADGSLVVEGRLRDFVKRGGYFVGLREIELVAERLPLVAEAAAVGVPHKFYGEAIYLFAKFKEGTPPAEGRLKAEEWLRSNLARHTWVERVIDVDQLPRTSSGKIQKHLLRDRVPPLDPAAP